MRYQVLNTDPALRQLMARLGSSATVAVDTEFMRHDSYYPQAGLIQLCFSDEPASAWLLDPLALSDLEPLRALLVDGAVLKVLHSASEDLSVLRRLVGQYPLPLFDSQRAAAYLGLGFGLGYRALIQKISGLELAKDETRSDWLARPLSDSQLHYAAADVVPLLSAYASLQRDLSARERLHWLLEDGVDAVRACDEAVPCHLRIKSAWKLSARQLALLMAVCDWREQQAIRYDKPRGWILADKVCLLIARQAPNNLDELRDLPAMPAALLRRQGQQLLQRVQRVQQLPAEQLPPPLPPPLNARQREQLKHVKATARQLARAWQMDAGVLLPAGDYELLVRQAAGARIAQPARWQGWRREQLIAPLLRAAAQG